MQSRLTTLLSVLMAGHAIHTAENVLHSHHSQFYSHSLPCSMAPILCSVWAHGVEGGMDNVGGIWKVGCGMWHVERGMWHVECEGCPASNLLMSVLMVGHTPHTMHTVKNVHPSYQSQLHHSRSLLSQSAGRRRQPTHVSLEVVAILRRPWCLF